MKKIHLDQIAENNIDLSLFEYLEVKAILSAMQEAVNLALDVAAEEAVYGLEKKDEFGNFVGSEWVGVDKQSILQIKNRVFEVTTAINF